MSLGRENLSHSVWFLDYDGSLCPHQEVWEQRIYNPQEIDFVLKHLAEKKAELLWNTGRRPESLGEVLHDFLNYSGYFIYGGVYWDASRQKRNNLAPLLGQVWLDKFMEADVFDEKLFRKEMKPTALRVAPTQLALLSDLKMRVLEFGYPPGWEWSVGHRGAEMLPLGFDKGSAVRDYFKRHAGASPKKIPIAVGDDILDLPAIRECIERGGYGAIVGENCGWITELPHKSSQILYFDRPKDFHEFVLNL